MTFEEIRNILEDCNENVAKAYQEVRSLYQDKSNDRKAWVIAPADSMVWAVHNLLCAAIEMMQEEEKFDSIYVEEKLRKALKAISATTIYAVIQDGKSLYSSGQLHKTEEYFENLKEEILDNWFDESPEFSDEDFENAWQEYCANANEEDIPRLARIRAPLPDIELIRDLYI